MTTARLLLARVKGRKHKRPGPRDTFASAAPDLAVLIIGSRSGNSQRADDGWRKCGGTIRTISALSAWFLARPVVRGLLNRT